MIRVSRSSAPEGGYQDVSESVPGDTAQKCLLAINEFYVGRSSGKGSFGAVYHSILVLDIIKLP